MVLPAPNEVKERNSHKQGSQSYYLWWQNEQMKIYWQISYLASVPQGQCHHLAQRPVRYCHLLTSHLAMMNTGRIVPQLPPPFQEDEIHVEM